MKNILKHIVYIIRFIGTGIEVASVLLLATAIAVVALVSTLYKLGLTPPAHY